MKTKTTKPAVTTYDVAWYVHERDLAPGGSPIARPDVAILLGQSDRPWFEIRSPHGRPRPIGRIRSVVPASLDFDGALLDALLALCPERFETCPSLRAVEAKLARTEMLDFHLGASRIPAEWAALRQEARPLYERLAIVRVDAPIVAPETFLVRPGRREGA
ncbi:MAG TPA: hypothetical protein PLL76_21645 [Thermoanaerobaculia bacterium]|nr:hypothetical protein [Thermoanaerobaculia bacterium]